MFTLKQAMSHILAVGRPGAGKTTFLDHIQRQLLLHDVACLHCCVKPDESDRARRIMPAATVFSPSCGFVFNPLTYEMKARGSRNLAAFHDDLNEVLTRSTDEKSESFWKSGATDCRIAAFEIVYLAKGEDATYQDVLAFLSSAPIDPGHVQHESFKSSPCGQMIAQALEDDYRRASPHAAFILDRLTSIGEKARGAFLTQAITSIQPFTVPPLCDAVNGRSTLTPEMMLTGQTILDFDTLTYGLNGLAFNLLVSWFMLDAVLRRRRWRKPFLLVRDEFHLLAFSRRDVQALSVGRSQGLISLAAFQTIPTLEDALGGGLESQVQAKALTGLHVNKVWCNNNCHITNEFASMSMGQEKKFFFGGALGQQSDIPWWDVFGVGRPNFNFHQNFHYRVEPHEFLDLSTGGEENHRLVEAIVHRGAHDIELFSLKQRRK